MSRGPTTYVQKLGQRIRLLNSDSEGEALAALRALQRTLESNGEDLDALAARVEKANGHGLSNEDMQRLYHEGVTDGRRQAEEALRRYGSFHDISEVKDPWGQIADFCQERCHRLSDHEAKFVKGMTGLTREKALSPKQARWLLNIYNKFGGRLD